VTVIWNAKNWFICNFTPANKWGSLGNRGIEFFYGNTNMKYECMKLTTTVNRLWSALDQLAFTLTYPAFLSYWKQELFQIICV
jgi:hypothetical protein